MKALTPAKSFARMESAWVFSFSLLFLIHSISQIRLDNYNNNDNDNDNKFHCFCYIVSYSKKYCHCRVSFPVTRYIILKVAEHSFQVPMPNSPLLLNYLCFGTRFLQESRLTVEVLILAFWLGVCCCHSNRAGEKQGLNGFCSF